MARTIRRNGEREDGRHYPTRKARRIETRQDRRAIDRELREARR